VKVFEGAGKPRCARETSGEAVSLKIEHSSSIPISAASQYLVAVQFED
jgi:hypothetical protein